MASSSGSQKLTYNSIITIENGSSGLSEVIHDTTLTGNGTSGYPLSASAALAEKQNTLVPGTNIDITNNTISASVSTDGVTLTGTGSAGSPLSISNPSYYIKGNTVYGGTLTDNLNTLSRTTPFTCYGTATGAPDTSYSWFGWHLNSNTGTTAAAQIAYAYNSAEIICYERVKVTNAWGAWKRRSLTGDHKLLVSSTDAEADYLFNKIESTTLTITYSVDATTGKQKLDANVVNSASGYPNNYEPFFPSAAYKKLGTETYSGISSTALTRGFFFSAPRSMTVANIGIYLRGEPSPSGLMQIELAVKDMVNNVVRKTATKVINVTNFPNLSSGSMFTLPLTESLAITGSNPYVLYLMLKSSDGSRALSSFSNLQFMETCDFPTDSLQIESGIYSQYSSQNFEGWGDTSYSGTACRPYMFISE